MSHYRIVSCELHSQFELHAMQKNSITLELTDNQVVEGIISDIVIIERAEYLILTCQDGTSRQIRLDTVNHIRS